jgi:glutamyl-tRNA reductase
MRRKLLLTKLSKEAKHGNEYISLSSIINYRVTYKKAPISVLSALTFKNAQNTFRDIKGIDDILECLLLQTCNRVEIYAVVSRKDGFDKDDKIGRYWQQKTKCNSKDFYRLLEKASGLTALMHLMRLSAGLESMIIGEDQILGQIERAFEEGKRYGTVGPILQQVFEQVIKTGRKIRLKTMINKGAISIGNIAVNRIEDSIGDLTTKKIIIIGAGENGALVGKALANRRSSSIFIANRTYNRAIQLAKVFGGKAVRFSELKKHLITVDAVIVTTAAPHYILTHGLISEIMGARNGKALPIIDLSNPRNVEEIVADLPNVELLNLDNLRGIAYKKLRMRKKECKKADKIIIDELSKIVNKQKLNSTELLISTLWKKVERVRSREAEKAVNLLRKLHGNNRFQNEIHDRNVEIIENLSHTLVKRLFSDPTFNLRRASIDNDFDILSIAQKLFNINVLDTE